MNMRWLLLSICICMISNVSVSQEPTFAKLAGFPHQYYESLTKKFKKLQAKLERQSQAYLRRNYLKEKNLQRSLEKVDTTAAKEIFKDLDRYFEFAKAIKNPSKSDGKFSGEYLPYVDSIGASLLFLQQFGKLSSADHVAALNALKELQGKFQRAEAIKQFLKERQRQLQNLLSSHTRLPNSAIKEVAKYQQEVYYFSQQIHEYRLLFNDPSKVTQKAITLLNRLPAFQQFMKEHSELGNLFRLPENYAAMQTVAGLQTRSQVQQVIQNQSASAGSLSTQMIPQSVQSAQSQLDRFKDKLGKLGAGSGDVEMPDFKPNNQRTKTFFNRLEYGSNLQTTRSNVFFPTTTDVGLSIGYKLNDRSIIGVGSSYKIGWGKDIRHMSVTSEGLSLRSFADYKLKGTFFLSGGLEYNYQEPFNSFSRLMEDLGRWQKSGLIGITKTVSIKSKLFKKYKLQLLYDLLYHQQMPNTQPVKFRIGYNF